MKKIIAEMIHFPLRMYAIILIALILPILALANMLGKVIYKVVEWLAYGLLFPGNVDYGKWKWGTMSWSDFDYSMEDIRFADVLNWYKNWLPKKEKKGVKSEY